jgi:hypothetical protein
MKNTYLLFLLLMFWGVGINGTKVKAAGDNCHKINAKLVGAFAIPPDCPSPLGLCSHGKIIGGGLLNGTSQATLLSVAPSAGLGNLVPPSKISVVEDSVITTEHGTLTLREVGIVDNANGEIVSLLDVLGGTERFEGSTGVLSFRGMFTDPTNFEGDLTGEICLLP